jgi:hypothetical protein
MIGMRCDGCNHVLVYRAEVVAVTEENGERQASVVLEDTPDLSGPLVGKYHPSCYEEARSADSSLPIVLA